MAEKQPSAKSNPDELAKPAKKGEVELQENDLDKATGGAGNFTEFKISQTYDKASP